MSNRPHRRRRQVRVPKARALDLARVSAALRGCTCAPDVHVRHTSYGARATIAHDDGCPVIDRQTTRRATNATP